MRLCFHYKGFRISSAEPYSPFIGFISATSGLLLNSSLNPKSTIFTFLFGFHFRVPSCSSWLNICFFKLAVPFVCIRRGRSIVFRRMFWARRTSGTAAPGSALSWRGSGGLSIRTVLHGSGSFGSEFSIRTRAFRPCPPMS